MTFRRNFLLFAAALLVSFLVAIPYPAVGSSSTVNAADYLKSGVAMFVSSPVAFIDGQEAQVEASDWKVVPYEKNDVIMVPVRFTAQSLGAKVAWDSKSAAVTITSGGKKISLAIGSPKIKAGTVSVTTAVPTEIIDGRTFAELRPLVTALGKKVFYDSGLIIISDSDININPADQHETVHKIIMLFNKQYNSSNTDGSELETTIRSEDPAIRTILNYFEAVNEQNHIKYKSAVSKRMKQILPDWSRIYRVRVVSIDEQKATITRQEYLDSFYARYLNPLEVRVFAVQKETHNVREPMGVGYFSEDTQNFVVVRLTSDGPWLIDFIGDEI